MHQQIEETFRLLKQEVGWGAHRARKLEVQIAHLYLGLVALCLTQQIASTRKQTIYALKRELFLHPIPRQLPFLEEFLSAA